MCPAVVAAFLLLLGGLEAVRAGYISGICDPPSPCGDGWSYIDQNHCAKYIKDPKAFSEAQVYCQSLDSDLVSVHSEEAMFNLLCLTFDFETFSQNLWIGAEKSEGQFKWTDGSPFDFTNWLKGEPNGTGPKADCTEINFSNFGMWNVAKCTKKNFFVCAKKK